MKEDGAQALFDGIMRIHGMLRKIERAGMDPKTLKGGKPIVAALPGTGLGIGFELPLACHRIIVATTPRPRLGCRRFRWGFSPAPGGRRV